MHGVVHSHGKENAWEWEWKANNYAWKGSNRSIRILYHASNIRHLIYLSERSSNTRYASYSTFKSQHKGINSNLRILALHSLHQTPGMHLIHCITITSQANNETEKFEDNLCLVNDSKQRDNEAASCLSSGSFTPFCSSLPFHALLQFLSFDAPSSTSLLI